MGGVYSSEVGVALHRDIFARHIKDWLLHKKYTENIMTTTLKEVTFIATSYVVATIMKPDFCLLFKLRNHFSAVDISINFIQYD